MQTGLNIDTLSAVEGLIASGMPQSQAKAMIEIFKNVEVSSEVKKSEIEEIKVRLDRVETKLNDLRVETAGLIIKIPGIIIAAAALYKVFEKFI